MFKQIYKGLAMRLVIGATRIAESLSFNHALISQIKSLLSKSIFIFFKKMKGYAPPFEYSTIELPSRL